MGRGSSSQRGRPTPPPARSRPPAPLRATMSGRSSHRFSRRRPSPWAAAAAPLFGQDAVAGHRRRCAACSAAAGLSSRRCCAAQSPSQSLLCRAVVFGAPLRAGAPPQAAIWLAAAAFWPSLHLLCRRADASRPSLFAVKESLHRCRREAEGAGAAARRLHGQAMPPSWRRA
ncbi:hypothetical protein E2562_003388 [Oryza meyeriana var. granulata]|uniref:Uncharacterized protein n=1 Tax=Oryza meyeriana var. granulata TaxID=110450 RepID=A0A6G1EEI0_9ORYZ|nr:hypothetical protein E2562_003388 [Oryza meyeriana var. granulata]